MELKVTSANEALLRIEASGHIGSDVTLAMSDPLRAHLGASGYANCVLLNMTHVAMVDSMGISWLLTCHKRFTESGGRLVIHSVPASIMNVFRVLRMDLVFALADNEASAERLVERNAA